MSKLMTDEERRARLDRAAERVGGKAELGRRLGYKDGAFVGQMIRGERPITEKTLLSLLELREVADLFSWRPGPAPGVAMGFVMPGNDEGPKPPDRSSGMPSDLASALQVVLDALDGCAERDELRRLLPLIIDTQAAAYRQRLADLLGAQPTNLDGPNLTPQDREDARRLQEAASAAAAHDVMPKKDHKT